MGGLSVGRVGECTAVVMSVVELHEGFDQFDGSTTN